MRTQPVHVHTHKHTRLNVRDPAASAHERVLLTLDVNTSENIKNHLSNRIMSIINDFINDAARARGARIVILYM